MTKTRNLSDLLDANGKVDNTDILNVDASKITTGTLDAGRIDNASLANVTALPFSAGTDWQSTIVTGTTLTAVAGKGYWIDTTSNACTVTLPASASVGDFIEFSDYARTWGTNSITINQNSLNFQGNSSPNPEYNTNGQSVKIIYSGATQGWIPTVDDDVTLETPQSYSADFLVIAGGGGGGRLWHGGGGGAGGYRNSYSTESSGGGGSSESSLTFNPGTVYTITVGAGGAGASSVNGNQGENSSITGSNITDITSIGGGFGGGYENTGGDGGSGGGSGGNVSSTGYGNATANQGFRGSANTTSNGAGGAGGGASAVGETKSEQYNTGTGANGGAGLSSSITGSSVGRAGGGAGGNTNGGGTATDGGGATDSAGTANTGGGGGARSTNNNGMNGGSGIVILRMATADYTGTTSGSPTVSTDGTDTILIYNASGSYTA